MTALLHQGLPRELQQNFDQLMKLIDGKLPASDAGTPRPPQGPETNLKVIRGTVDSSGAGSIVEGAGFSITRNGVGDITVTFTAAFSDRPSVTTGGNADRPAAFVTMPSTTSFRVNMKNLVAGAFAAADAQFMFIAVGPA